MQAASFVGVIETIFYFVVFYYVFKFLAKIFLPILVKKVVQKAGESFQQQYTNQQQNRKEDPVFHHKNKTQKPKETKKVGEYVDFEEID